MKNKNGYYSWIHKLNSAVMQSNQIGKKMLAEAKGEKGFDSIASGLAAEYPRDVRIDRKDVGKSSQQIFDQLRAEKEALGTLHKLSAEGLAALTPKAATSQNTTSAPVLPKSTKRTTIDLNNDGVVNDTDAHIDDMDGQPGDNNSSFSDATPSRLPSYLLAAQARLEAGYGLPGDEERVRQHELEQEEKSYGEDEEARRDLGLPPGSGEGPRTRLGESVSDKIKRLLK